MPKRKAAAARVAAFINEAERSLDEAMARTSILVSELPTLQRDAGLNGAWAQPAVASICSALSDLTSARGGLIDAHRSLSAVQRKLGIEVLETPNQDKPSDPESRPVLRQDKVVPIAA